MSWKPLGVPPESGPQCLWHGSILADKTNPDRVFVGGSTPAVGTPNASLFVGNAAPLVPTWTRITGPQLFSGGIVIGGANSTSPHADSRNMLFDASGNILEADDGGIYRLDNTPTPSSRVWRSLNSNLRNTEFVAMAYDRTTDEVIGGAQDNGSPAEVENGSNALSDFQWTQTGGGDGGFKAVDNSNPNQSIRYSLDNNFQFFDRRTVTVVKNAAGSITSETMSPPTTVRLSRAPGTPALSGLNNPADSALVANRGAALIPFALNNITPGNRM